MNLLINDTLKAVTEINLSPDKTMFQLTVTITGPYDIRTGLNHTITSTLKNDHLSLWDSMSLGEDGPSVINIFNCTSLQFIDSLRKNNMFKIVEIGPELKKV